MCILLCTDVNLSLNGAFIPNHGYVLISDVGSNDTTALLCHTNRPPLHRLHHSEGDWYTPVGTRVVSKSSIGVRGFVRNRGPMVVRLLKSSSNVALEGIYHCSIQDNKFTNQTVYVGLYNHDKGGIA